MKKEHDYYQLSLKVIMKNNKGEILSLGTPNNSSYAGFYDFPGGRIEKQEFTTPLTDVLKREVKEEIGNIEYKLNPIPVSVGRHILKTKISGLAEYKHILYLFFEAHYISGDIIISNEHTGYKWFDMEKVEPEQLFKSGNLEGVNMYLNATNHSKQAYNR